MAEELVDDRRAALEAAFDKVEAEETANTETIVAAEEASVPETELPATDEAPPQAETEQAPVEPKQQEASEEELAAQASREQAAESESARFAAPVGWRGAAKQQWDKLPQEVREEVNRREREIGGAMREAAEARQFRDQFDQMIDPYRSLIAARGADPMQATQAMLQTHAALTMGTPQQKAQTIARAIHEYGIDIDQLASAIDGQPAPAPGNGAVGNLDPGVQQYLQQQLAPMQQFMDSWRQNEQNVQQQTEQEAAADIDAFAADPKNAYFEDVRYVMGDLMEVAGKQGREMSLEQAYRMAIQMDPELAQTYQQQETAPTLQEAQTASERRAAAASSIAPRAQPATLPEPKNRREAIEQAFDKLSSGGV